MQAKIEESLELSVFYSVGDILLVFTTKKHLLLIR